MSGLTTRECHHCGEEMTEYGDGEYVDPYFYCPICLDYDYDFAREIIGLHGYED